MTERREPTISSMPIDSRDDNGRARAKNAPPGSPPPRNGGPPPRPVSQRPVIVRSKLAPVAFVLTVLVAAFAGFTYMLLQQAQGDLNEAVAQLRSAEARVAQLEKRFELSDDESSQSLTVVQANVKENSSEIRKLWGVSYDRNRKAISTIEESLKKLQATASTLDEKLQSSVAELSGELRVVSELVDAQQTAISRSTQAVQSQESQFAEIAKKLDALDTDLRKKVLANEEAVRSIDAFRLQVNRELLQLKGG